jgi:hypothetical protein
MILEDTTPLFDSLMGFHRRVERHLALLVSLPTLLATDGPSPRTCAAADALLHCFDRECARRHAEEERELWPLLERRIADDLQRARFRSLRRTLAEQHRGIEHVWRGVRRPLHAVAEGLSRQIAAEDVVHMRALFASHIHGEEAALYRVAASLPR